ncbi:putative 3-oxo-5-beta-steroid 4-dehydrogenase [Methylobacterium sp. ME121]|nr:putative 3-oxo-5-beta-steroid 4-dehydrogenase [Methylobacterium sp. ME121]
MSDGDEMPVTGPAGTAEAGTARTPRLTPASAARTGIRMEILRASAKLDRVGFQAKPEARVWFNDRAL